MDSQRRHCRVYVAERGNVFMREIASWLVAALAENGQESELCTLGVPEASPGVLNLVVAPHEYFELDFDPGQRARAAAACVPICTEQPGTPWFETQMTSLSHSPMVLDINPMGVAELARRGVSVAHLPLGYQRSFDRWGGPPTGASALSAHSPVSSKRPIDVLFLGSLTPRREAVLAELASDLQSLRCRLVLFESHRPARHSDPGFYSGMAKHELLASAKVLLNVHRNDVPYFESVRALEAVANGAVLLSEPSLDHGLFEPVRHVVTAPLSSLGATCRALVADDGWLTDVREAAYEHLRARPLAAELQRLWPRLLAATDGVGARGRVLRSPRVHTARSVLATSAVARAAHQRLEPPAVTAPQPPPGGVTDGLFKRVLLGQMQLRRRLDEIECLVRHGATRFDEPFHSAAYHEVRPDVSVVIPCYNYGRFVIDAIDSVASSVDVVPEIIVIDDHSDDGSSDLVRHYAQTHDWVPLQLVTRHANGGLAAARNLGFELARAPYVFPLDADNLLYPHALARLAEVLLGSGAAAAYGILEVFNDRQGLLSAIGWSVERLVAGPYIDAAALIRKDAWARIGGYATDRAELFGWEDYDLWLNLADHGLGAAFVPELLVRYRSHGASMIHTTNIDTLSVAALLRARYRNLPWPELAV
ncbi:MAG: glycosyltransferase [Acidimicrobiales bacterium]